MNERSVFSELIGGQRQQRQEEEEDDEADIDTGLIEEVDEDDQENRGFFEEPDFGFNSGREKFNFPGDERQDIPMLPEIENRENREPVLPSSGGYYEKPYHYAKKPYYPSEEFYDPIYKSSPIKDYVKKRSQYSSNGGLFALQDGHTLTDINSSIVRVQHQYTKKC